MSPQASNHHLQPTLLSFRGLCGGGGGISPCASLSASPQQSLREADEEEGDCWNCGPIVPVLPIADSGVFISDYDQPFLWPLTARDGSLLSGLKPPCGLFFAGCDKVLRERARGLVSHPRPQKGSCGGSASQMCVEQSLHRLPCRPPTIGTCCIHAHQPPPQALMGTKYSSELAVHAPIEHLSSDSFFCILLPKTEGTDSGSLLSDPRQTAGAVVSFLPVLMGPRDECVNTETTETRLGSVFLSHLGEVCVM